MANALGETDRRGLTPLFHTNTTPYGDIQLRMDRRLDLSDPGQPSGGSDQ